MKLRLFSDGGSRGNPGPAAYGYVVYDGAGKILEKCGNYLGPATNNQAEYAGVLAGLTWVHEHHPDADIAVFLDSLLIVNQLKGLYKVKNAALQPTFFKVHRLLISFPSYHISHVRREHNSAADALVNQALDQALL